MRREKWRARSVSCAVSSPHLHSTRACESSLGCRSDVDINGTLFLSVIVFVLRSAEFLGESDEKPFRPADVAEPIRVFILDYFAYELRAALAEPIKRLVDVVHGEHDAEVAQSVHRGVAVSVMTPHETARYPGL